MGKNITLVGGNGDGQTTKVANQIIVALTIEAVGEALLFAAKAGADPAKVRQALMGGFASSRILEVHGERMVKRTFDPGFRIELHQKDLNLALSTARQIGLSLPNTATAQELFNAAPRTAAPSGTIPAWSRRWRAWPASRSDKNPRSERPRSPRQTCGRTKEDCMTTATFGGASGAAERKTHIRWLIVVILFVVTSVNYADRATISIAGPVVSKQLGLDASGHGLRLLGVRLGLRARRSFPAAGCSTGSARRCVYALSILAWSVFTAAAGPGRLLYGRPRCLRPVLAALPARRGGIAVVPRQQPDRRGLVSQPRSAARRRRSSTRRSISRR